MQFSPPRPRRCTGHSLRPLEWIGGFVGRPQAPRVSTIKDDKEPLGILSIQTTEDLLEIAPDRQAAEAIEDASTAIRSKLSARGYMASAGAKKQFSSSSVGCRQMWKLSSPDGMTLS